MRRSFRSTALIPQGLSAAYAFTTLPLRRHPVQTRMRLLPCAVLACTGRKLMFQRRLVMLCAWLTLLPETGFLPHISQTCAMIGAPNYESGGSVPERLLAAERSTSSPKISDFLKIIPDCLAFPPVYPDFAHDLKQLSVADGQFSVTLRSDALRLHSAQADNH